MAQVARLGLLVTGLFVYGAQSVSAEMPGPRQASPAVPPAAPVALRYDNTTSVALTASALGTALLLDTVLKGPLAPKACRWCGPSVFDRDVREALLWRHPVVANATSWATVGTTAVVAYGGLLWAGPAANAWEDVVILSEAVSFAWLTTSIAKFSAGRQRPAVHYESVAAGDFPRDDVNLSFFSQHTSLAFALAVGAGTIASRRRYALAPAIWLSGLGVAAVTAWLRVAADAHYASDVITGAMVGTLGGALVPYLLHPPTGAGGRAAFRVRISPMAGGTTGLRVTGRF